MSGLVKYKDGASIEHVKYVTKGGNDANADGSLMRPYLTLQAAYDACAASDPIPSPTNLYTIIICSGVYDECLICDFTSGISFVGLGSPNDVKIIVNDATKPCVVITNCSRESIDVFLDNGGFADPNAHYADLEIGETCVTNITFNNIAIGDDVENSVLVLGKGAGCLLGEITFLDCVIFGYIWARTCDTIKLENCGNRGNSNNHIKIYNCYTITVSRSSISSFTSVWDSTGLIYDLSQYGIMGGGVAGGLWAVNTSIVWDIILTSYPVGSGESYPCVGVSARDIIAVASSVSLVNSYLSRNITIDANSTYFGKNVHIGGNLSITAGVLLCKSINSEVVGTLTNTGGSARLTQGKDYGITVLPTEFSYIGTWTEAYNGAGLFSKTRTSLVQTDYAILDIGKCLRARSVANKGSRLSAVEVKYKQTVAPAGAPTIGIAVKKITVGANNVAISAVDVPGICDAAHDTNTERIAQSANGHLVVYTITTPVWLSLSQGWLLEIKIVDTVGGGLGFVLNAVTLKFTEDPR